MGEILEGSNGLCAHCGCELTTLIATKEHVIPKSWGGIGEDANLVPLCQKCNRSRGNKMITNLSEYYKYLTRERMLQLKDYLIGKGVAYKFGIFADTELEKRVENYKIIIDTLYSGFTSLTSLARNNGLDVRELLYRVEHGETIINKEQQEENVMEVGKNMETCVEELATGGTNPFKDESANKLFGTGFGSDEQSTMSIFAVQGTMKENDTYSQTVEAKYTPSFNMETVEYDAEVDKMTAMNRSDCCCSKCGERLNGVDDCTAVTILSDTLGGSHRDVENMVALCGYCAGTAGRNLVYIDKEYPHMRPAERLKTMSYIARKLSLR